MFSSHLHFTPANGPAVSESPYAAAPRGLPEYAKRGKYAGRWALAPASEQAPEPAAPRKYYFYFVRGGRKAPPATYSRAGPG